MQHQAPATELCPNCAGTTIVPTLVTSFGAYWRCLGCNLVTFVPSASPAPKSDWLR